MKTCLEKNLSSALALATLLGAGGCAAASSLDEKDEGAAEEKVVSTEEALWGGRTDDDTLKTNTVVCVDLADPNQRNMLHGHSTGGSGGPSDGTLPMPCYAPGSYHPVPCRHLFE